MTRAMGPGLYGVRLYGDAVQNKTLRRVDLKTQDSTVANSHVSFINMSYESDKSFKSSKLDFEIINLIYNRKCLKIIISR